MTVSSALILAAGHGTRMGKIGKEIPKALWPLFERELLYLQLCLMKERGISEVFINTHHQADIFERYIDSVQDKFPSLNITILRESPILDSGGAIHNCLKYVKGDYLLVVNADVFYLPESMNLCSITKRNPKITLFAIAVGKDSAYNRLVVSKNGELKEIVSPSKWAPCITFSGVSLINCKELLYQPGPSKFFESVARFKKESVQVKYDARYEYLDFGTKGEYLSLIRAILLSDGHPLFKDKLRAFGCFNNPDNSDSYLAHRGFWNYEISGCDFFCGTSERLEHSTIGKLSIANFCDSF